MESNFKAAMLETLQDVMGRFPEYIPELSDPTLIPDDAHENQWHPEGIPARTPFIGAGLYYTKLVTDALPQIDRKIDYQDIFDRHALDGGLRTIIRTAVRSHGHGMYSPGIFAMAQLWELVPYVAERDGASREDWEEIGNKTIQVAKLIATHPTLEQATIRDYTGIDFSEAPNLDAGFYTLDSRKGITTATPVTEMLEITDEIRNRIDGDNDRAGLGSCPALITRLDELNVSVFDMFWSSYGKYVTNRIFPNLEIPEQSDAYPVPDREELEASLEDAMIQAIQERNMHNNTRMIEQALGL